MKSHFFAYIARMRYITRWALMRNTFSENVQEHSHMVAVLAHALAVIRNRVYGGQIDAGQVAAVALYKCVEELKAGNAEFRRAAEQTRAALDAMHLPELDYFMEHCAESFSMTLDELE